MPVIGFGFPASAYMSPTCEGRRKIETGISASSMPTMPLVPFPRYARTSANEM